jgi:hypothetical protein
MAEPIKLCLFCKHCLFVEGWGGTEETAGDDSHISCYRSQRGDPESPFDRLGFVAWTKKAVLCPHYTPDTP